MYFCIYICVSNIHIHICIHTCIYMCVFIYVCIPPSLYTEACENLFYLWKPFVRRRLWTCTQCRICENLSCAAARRVLKYGNVCACNVWLPTHSDSMHFCLGTVWPVCYIYKYTIMNMNKYIHMLCCYAFLHGYGLDWMFYINMYIYIYICIFRFLAFLPGYGLALMLYSWSDSIHFAWVRFGLDVI